MSDAELKAINQIATLIKQGRDNKEIQDITRQVIVQENIKFGDNIGELDAIYGFVQGRVRYIRDPYGKDIYQSAGDTLFERKTGDCEDLTILIAAMTMTIGYPIGFKLVSISGEIWDHIYPLAGIPPEGPTKWVAMDATISNGRLGAEPESTHQQMFIIGNGILTGEKDAWVPIIPWQDIVMKILPFAILAPIVIFMLKTRAKK